MSKYARIRELLAEDGFYSFDRAPLADPDDIKLAHDSEYVDAFMGGKLSAQAIRRIGFPWSEALVQRTLAAVGGTLCATVEALETGWGGNP